LPGGKDDSLCEWDDKMDETFGGMSSWMIRFANGMTNGMNDCLKAGMIPSELGRLDE